MPLIEMGLVSRCSTSFFIREGREGREVVWIYDENGGGVIGWVAVVVEVLRALPSGRPPLCVDWAGGGGALGPSDFVVRMTAVVG